MLAWRLSNTMDVDFCVAVLKEALARFGTPAVFNTDQGNPFTSRAFISVLEDAGPDLHRRAGRCMDNIFIQCLWRSLKYEAVYLHELGGGFEARRVIGGWMAFYNAERPHSVLGGRILREA